MLTEQLMRELRDTGGKTEVILWHDTIPGFGFRLRKSGVRTWIFYYRYRRRRYKTTIGQYPAMTLKQAEAEASRMYLILKSGQDPTGQERRLSGEITMGQLIDEYLRRETVHQKTARLKEWRFQKWVLPALGQRRVSEVDREDVIDLHARIGRRGQVEANRVLSLLARVFECAKAWGYLTESAPNPARRVKRFPEKPRTRWLKPEELLRLIESVSLENDLYVRYGFFLYLLTGLRNRELIRVKWEEIDFDKRTMVIPDNKSSRPYIVHLNDIAVAILKDMPRVPGSPYVFTNVNTGTHLTQFSRKAWDRVRQRAGLEDVTIHDLRRTFGTWLASSGVPIKIIAGALNQTSQSITDTIYAHLANDPLREAFQKSSDILRPLLESQINDKLK